MIRIESIRAREIHLELREPFKISSGMQYVRRIVLLEITDADGAVGWSECVAGEKSNYMPESVDVAWLTLEQFIGPRVVGRDLDGPEQVRPLLEENMRGHWFAKGAVEMGVWELAARKQGVPLAKLLGGVRERIPVGVSIGLQESPEKLVEKARAYQTEGYRKIKIKVKPGSDVAFVQAVRQDLGPEASLMADANNAYTLDDFAVLKQLDELSLTMIEQPLAWDDVVQHAKLQRELKTPICLDESITGADRVRDMLELDSGRIVNIKPGRVGGFLSSRQIHDLCQANGVPVWCGGMLESGIGRAHNVALASLPNFTLPGDVSPSARYWERDIVEPEWTMDPDGMVNVPLDKPGMGVEVDRDRVAELTVREMEVRAK